ncbi:MAG: hypothetical protein R6W71_10455 [Bacteroidales bacterium]
MSKVVSLNVKCPHCDHSLMDESHLINNKPGICLDIQTSIRQKGNIWLSSIYGDYNYSSEFTIPEGDVVEFYCPHCNQSLRRKKVECDLCEAPIVSFNCTIGGRVSICSRHGCKNHYIVFEDLDTTIRKFYEDYEYR